MFMTVIVTVIVLTYFMVMAYVAMKIEVPYKDVTHGHFWQVKKMLQTSLSGHINTFRSSTLGSVPSPEEVAQSENGSAAKGDGIDEDAMDLAMSQVRSKQVELSGMSS